MRLRELFENIYEVGAGDQQEVDGALKTIGVCFGRWNPPHRGHKAVWQAASTNPIWYVGTNQSTSGPKDPLPYDIKLQCMQAVWSKVGGHVIPEQSLLTLATRIYEKHGENVHLKVYTDEEWLVNTLQQYNGTDKEHGMYKFHQIDHVRTERLASATNLRAAVRAGDKATFYKDMGIKPSVTVRVDDRDLPVFEVVAHYLNMYPEKTKKAAVAEGSAGKVGKGGTKTIDKEKKAAMKNATTLPGLNMSTGSMYKNYRMSIALAGAPTYPTKMEADNWIGGDPLVSSYTEEEYEMVKAAALQVGAGKLQNWSGDRSKEIADVNKTSTVAKIKKNKYGI
jgi:nicotinamide mononucleotide adenylyltransferase